MKIAVFGATGLIGRRVVEILNGAGHEVVGVARGDGVDVTTGEGLAGVLDGVDTVVNVINALIWDEDGIIEFFESAEHNIAAAEKAAGVAHHVVLSVVGVDRMPVAGYMAGKYAQERAVRESGVPYTIVRATQTFEFIPTIALAGEVDGVSTVTSLSGQPVAAAEVSELVANVSLASPLNGAVEIAGPERAPMSQFVARGVDAGGTARVVASAEAGYFGVEIDDTSLVPVGDYVVGRQTQAEWLAERA